MTRTREQIQAGIAASAAADRALHKEALELIAEIRDGKQPYVRPEIMESEWGKYITGNRAAMHKGGKGRGSV